MRNILMMLSILLAPVALVPSAAADVCLPGGCIETLPEFSADGCATYQRTYTGTLRNWYFVVGGVRDPPSTSVVTTYYLASWTSVYTYGRLTNGSCGVVQAFCDISVSDGSHFHADVIQGSVRPSYGEWKGVPVVISAISCNSASSASVAGFLPLGLELTGRTV